MRPQSSLKHILYVCFILFCIWSIYIILIWCLYTYMLFKIYTFIYYTYATVHTYIHTVHTLYLHYIQVFLTHYLILHYIYQLSSFQAGEKIPGHGRPTSHVPEIILSNFGTRLGRRTGRFLGSLFPHVCTVVYCCCCGSRDSIVWVASGIVTVYYMM